MKTTTALGLSLGLIAIAAIGYMVYDIRERKSSKVTPDYLQDDHRIYTLMRQELIAQLGADYGGWFDDEVNTLYNSGSAIVGGKKSKAAAFIQAYKVHAYNSKWAPKKTRFENLFTNLKNRYQ